MVIGETVRRRCTGASVGLQASPSGRGGGVPHAVAELIATRCPVSTLSRLLSPVQSRTTPARAAQPGPSQPPAAVRAPARSCPGPEHPCTEIACEILAWVRGPGGKCAAEPG